MKNNLEEFTYFSSLFEIYKNLLTDKQKDIMEKYYCYDLSLNEIATDLEISRSGVLDALSHAKDSLVHYEEKLHLLEKINRIKSTLDSSKTISDEEKEKIVEDLYYGI